MTSSTHLIFEPQITDSLLCTSHSSDFGVSGIPVPDTLANDDATTIILLINFVFIVSTIAFSRKFINKQFNRFFYENRSEEFNNVTSTELRVQLIFVMISCLLMGISSYFTATTEFPGIFIIHTKILNILLFSTLFIGYFAVKWTAHYITDIVFFGSKKTLQFFKIQLFIASCTTALLLPLVMLQVFLDLSIEKSVIWFCFILILNKILTFYKCWHIFFKQNDFFLQTFLYFCILEITPLFALGGIWLMMVNNLKINF